MIDLHMHTMNSDGEKTAIELLQLCEENKLKYISITDHDTCKAYTDLNNIDVTNYFNGKIIKGVEMTTSFEGCIIEILGYGVDIDVINEFSSKQYSLERLTQIENYEFNKLLDICRNLNLEYTQDLKLDIIKRGFSGKIIYNDLLKYEKNFEILGNDIMQNYTHFYRNGLANPKHKLFLNEAELHPTPKQVAELIRSNNGLCFLAHLYQYDVGNHIEFLNRLRKEVNLDGVECYHSRFGDEESKELLQYAKENNLLISGGSDYHGKSKPDIHIAVGTGNLNIQEEVLLPWVDKVELYK